MASTPEKERDKTAEEKGQPTPPSKPVPVPPVKAPEKAPPLSLSTDKKVELLLAEWKEVRESLRYFGTKRFAQLTVFITANGFMLNAYFAKDNPMPGLWGGALGVLLAVIFLMHERSSVAYFKRFARRGIQIEDELGVVKLIRSRPWFDVGTVATYLLYLIALLAWLAVIELDLVGAKPPVFRPQWARDVWEKVTNQPLPQPPAPPGPPPNPPPP